MSRCRGRSPHAETGSRAPLQATSEAVEASGRRGGEAQSKEHWVQSAECRASSDDSTDEATPTRQHWRDSAGRRLRRATAASRPTGWAVSAAADEAAPIRGRRLCRLQRTVHVAEAAPSACCVCCSVSAALDTLRRSQRAPVVAAAACAERLAGFMPAPLRATPRCRRSRGTAGHARCRRGIDGRKGCVSALRTRHLCSSCRTPYGWRSRRR